MNLENKQKNRGKFASNFGFLMAAVGSAVGLGNIWGFPYKAGTNGGFAFLLIYLILAVLLGYPLLVGEIALGRKTRSSAILAYKKVDKRFTIAGIVEALTPFFLLCFYCVLGGIVLRYMVGNLGDVFHASWGIGNTSSGDYFGSIISNGKTDLMWMFGFLLITAVVIMRGVESGVEKFSKYAMPALYLLLIITAIRCCTLPGAADGIAFMFKPNWEVFKGTGWLRVLKNAGSQLFFSLSLAAGCIISFGSYLDDGADIEKHALLVPILDSLAAILAGLCVLPAVFAAGIEPSAGPGLLFVSLQEVFKSMGSFGPFYGFLFYLLVFIAALSSSIGMMEGGVSVLIDHRRERGKTEGRVPVTVLAMITTTVGGFLVAFDQLGNNTAMWKPFLQPSWLDVFDMLGEGIAMPLGGLLMTIMLGWVHYRCLDDEIMKSSPYRSRKFVNFCLRYITPIIMVFIVFLQISAFFFSGTTWYQTLFG